MSRTLTENIAKLEELNTQMTSLLNRFVGRDVFESMQFRVGFSDSDFKNYAIRDIITTRVTDIRQLFFGCGALSNIDLTRWDLSNVNRAELVFNGCAALRSIIGDKTQTDVDNGLGALNGLTADLDLSPTSLETPSICAVLSGLGTITDNKVHAINLSTQQYNNVKDYTTIDYLQLAKNKGWTICFNGHAESTNAEDAPGTIIGKNTAGEITLVEYENFIKTDFDTTTFTPIAVLVIPKSHTRDGKCRGMSLRYMDFATPEDGGNNNTKTMMWGVTGTNLPLTDFSSATTGNVPLGGTLGVTANPYIPSDDFSGDASEVDKVGGFSISRYAGTTPYAPSPYGENGSANSQWWEGASNNQIQANTDMNGEANTAAIISAVSSSSASGVLIPDSGAITNAQENYPAAVCCYRFKGAGYTDHSWYLPACGELGYMVARQKAINDSLTAIKEKYGTSVATVLTKTTYHWTSTEYSATNARYFLPSSGFLYYGYKGNSSLVRAFHAF